MRPNFRKGSRSRQGSDASFATKAGACIDDISRILVFSRTPFAPTPFVIPRGFRRLTSGSRVSVVSLEIPGIVVSLEISVPGRKSVFYRKTGNFHRKNDQEKISEIFVHVDPENTGLNEVSEKSCSKNSF